MLRKQFWKLLIQLPRTPPPLRLRRIRNKQDIKRYQCNSIVILSNRLQETRRRIDRRGQEIEERDDGWGEHDPGDLALLAAVAVCEEVHAAEAEAEDDGDGGAATRDDGGESVEGPVADEGIDWVAWEVRQWL